MPSLDALAVDEISVTVSLSDLPSGTHRMTPVIELPAGFQLVKVDPPEVVVTIAGP
jgi:hypothetical protein